MIKKLLVLQLFVMSLLINVIYARDWEFELQKTFNFSDVSENYDINM